MIIMTIFFTLAAIELGIMSYGIFNSIKNINKIEKDNLDRLMRSQVKDIPDLSITGQFVKK